MQIPLPLNGFSALSALGPAPPSTAAGFLRRLGSSIEAALHLASAPGGHAPGAAAPPPQQQQSNQQQQPNRQQAGAKRQRVAALALVRALPMYGYHPEERPFIKIVL
ncbi:hypothetical protein MNEG_10077 [Monoraphidium neglectum]|jgi:hypothetical protein|uniref:DNA polymerase delta/zeta catalytic subunit N-terminal domain-containing protein n=1 Tax=Monoraphidium neglectum TaxID=145388 RepID=A0A0D2MTW8_9CHLO|nr:hypothetical protein MNEG_10077 [Monoraphidium neglectum]KIY97885.1 hypothetical protein MNEG_10077 [Monoraphidium neglectum]|eukprot:XP_013896905.1 hypothetical protein MNEG_10077 [Monoraphidium neglectum]